MIGRQVFPGNESVTDRAKMILAAISHFERGVIASLAFCCHEVVHDSPVIIDMGMLRFLIDVFRLGKHGLPPIAGVLLRQIGKGSTAQCLWW